MLVLNLQEREDIVIKDLKEDAVIAKIERLGLNKDNTKQNKVTLFDKRTGESIIEFTFLGERNKIGFEASNRFNIFRK